MAPYSTRDLLQKYANNPKQKGLTDEQFKKSYLTRVEQCDDSFNIYIGINNLNIYSARFSGDGCAISSAATELILKIISNKTIEEAKEIVNNYEEYILNNGQNVHEELKIFEIVKTHVSRKKCALAPINAIRKGLENE